MSKLKWAALVAVVVVVVVAVIFRWAKAREYVLGESEAAAKAATARA